MMQQFVTLSKFSITKKSVKAKQVQESGIYIDSYFDNDFLINVYALNKFFVKVIINIRKNTIVDYVPFEKDFYVVSST